jgi:hypothetical protein
LAARSNSSQLRRLDAWLFKGGKPVILYGCGQGINPLPTIAMACVLFRKAFPEITARMQARRPKADVAVHAAPATWIPP